MLKALRRQRLHVGLVLAVFLLFLANAAGLVQIVFELEGGIAFSPAPVRLGAATGGGAALAGSPEFLVLLAVGVVLCLALPLLSPIQASALTLLATQPVLYVSFTVTRPLAIPLEYSLLTVLVIFVVNVLISYFKETHEKQKLISVFGQYVPPELVKIISRDPERFTLDGEARELSVLFCDVHNFTTISEELSPRQLTELLNTLFTPLTAVIYEHRGTIDKYMGDAVMAFWGAPVNDPDHARHALQAAFAMQRAVDALAPEFAARGWPEIRVGIGLNSGVMSVGNMGSHYRIAYTVIGDEVNLASRIEQLTRVYGTPIIVGNGTRERVPELCYRELDVVRVKGKTHPARIFQPLGPQASLAPEHEARLRRHAQALASYHAGEHETAAGLFRALAAECPDDPVYPVYLERLGVAGEPAKT